MESLEEDRTTVGGEDVARAGVVVLDAAEHLPAAALLEVSERRPFRVWNFGLSSPLGLLELLGEMSSLKKRISSSKRKANRSTRLSRGLVYPSRVASQQRH